MNDIKKQELITMAQKYQITTDPSHDFEHVLRVMNLSLKIGEELKVDEEVLIPAALFHDIIVYKKDSIESVNETVESSVFVKDLLNKVDWYPKDKLDLVSKCIEECSFSKNISPSSDESKALQDADRLEATGAIAVMRTFASCGHMNHSFYPSEDPLCRKGVVKFRSGIDLFHSRLFIVNERLNTDFARNIAKNRKKFLEHFLNQLELELKEAGII